MPDSTIRPAAGRTEHAGARAPSRGFQPLRDLPTVAWLLLVVIAALAHRSLPVAGWLLLHLLLLGAVTHAILVWSQHFSFALTRTPHTRADLRGQHLRLALANGGAALVVVGVPTRIWPLTIVGSALLITAVLWHGVSIARRIRRALPGRFTRTAWYYVASAACLPVGAGVGTWLAGPGDPTGRLVLAHAIVNLLGWVGITVAGTLVTLWPTMLRTRADDRAPHRAAVALPVLSAAVVVAAAGAATGLIPVLLLGVTGYATGLGVIAVSLVRAARSAPPKTFAALSAGAALLWWFGCVAWLAVRAAAAWLDGSGFETVHLTIHDIAPYLAAGFAAQVLVGALSYLVPVVSGGGPTPVRIGTAALDRFGSLRAATANTALFVCALPVPSITRVVASALYLVAMAAFLPLLLIAIRRQAQAKRAVGSVPPAAVQTRRGAMVPEGAQAAGRRVGQAVAGLLAVTIVVALTGAIDPHSLAAPPTAASATATTTAADAPVQTARVTAADMRFTPNRIEVPVGTRLVIELTNTDDTLVHDLVLANGAQGTRLAPGESERIDAGIITTDVDGWCSIVGHRQMGMTLQIIAVGTGAGQASSDGPGGGAAPGGHSGHGSAGDAAGGSGSRTSDESAAKLIDPTRKPGTGFTPAPAVLDPLPPAPGPVTHRIELPVRELETEVAPGVQQRLWTFGGSAPGPVLRGRVGDTFEVTLVNDGTIGHSIDFHAGALAPDRPMRTIAPGETLVYRFTATRSGIWLYHCSTMPMSAHIANGMYGAVVIEPDGLPRVDRSYLLVQGEYYLGPQGGEVDMTRLATAQPDLVTFNGYANQYDSAPLRAAVGERVRVWVLDAGPNRATSFHVVGGQFDTVWSEGRYLIDRTTDTGSQALALQPAQGGFVELVFPEAGGYPFVSHIMVDAERGAHGVFQVGD